MYSKIKKALLNHWILIINIIFCSSLFTLLLLSINSTKRLLVDNNGVNYNQYVEPNESFLTASNEYKSTLLSGNDTATFINNRQFIAYKADYANMIGSHVIGNITIPSVQIDVPILKGKYAINYANGATLNAAWNQNIIVSSDKLPDFYTKELLEPLPKIREGSLIYLNDFKKIYTFKVFYKGSKIGWDSNIISPNKKTVLTLYRPDTTINKSTRYTFVQAKIIATKQLKKTSNMKTTSQLINLNTSSNNQQIALNIARYLDLKPNVISIIYSIIYAAIPLYIQLLYFVYIKLYVKK